MTVGEFKAWMDGYSEQIKGVPSQKQWKRIQEKLDEIYDCQDHYPYMRPFPWYVESTPLWKPFWSNTTTTSPANTTFTLLSEGAVS